MPEHERVPEHYVIVDVKWSRPDSYHYVTWKITNGGQFFKRGTQWLCILDRIRIVRADLPLAEETARSDIFRDDALHFTDQVRDKGDLEEVFKMVRERRERPGY